MTDQEIIEKILEIQIKEKLSQRKFAKMFGMGLTTITRILSGKQKICPSRRNILEMAFKLYDSGQITTPRTFKK